MSTISKLKGILYNRLTNLQTAAILGSEHGNLYTNAKLSNKTKMITLTKDIMLTDRIFTFVRLFKPD